MSYGEPMLWVWVLTVANVAFVGEVDELLASRGAAAVWGDAGLALAVVALIRFQRATDLSGRIAAGIGAMALGVLGLVMVAVLVV